jgi:hypothetical protein
MKESKTFKVGHFLYCTYCGKLAAKESEIVGRFYRNDYYSCTCEKAKIEMRLNKQIAVLKQQYPTEDIAIKNKLNFEYEVQILKEKFNIKD